MKKATIFTATLVAFLLSGPAFAARKVITDMPSTKTIFTGSTLSASADGVLTVTGAALTGELIPAPTNKSVAISPKSLVSTAKIGSLAKSVAKGGLYSIAAGYAFQELLDGLDWVMQDGALVKKQAGAGDLVYDPAGDYFYWWDGGSGPKTSTASTACKPTAYIDNDLNRAAPYKSLEKLSDTAYYCVYTRNYGNGNFEDYRGDIVQRRGDQCPAGSTNNPSTGTCVVSGSLGPLADSDYDLIDDFVKGKDGVWQRDITNQLCNGSDTCYQTLEPSTGLTGPATVTGTPSTVVTTSPSGSTTTTTTTPTTTITYGSNYYDYSTTTTTTTNSGGQTTTTTDDTDVSMPTVPNIFGGANGGLGGINDDIPKTSSTVNPLPYMPWWSFSQSCTEIVLTIPIYGPFTTANCPIYEKYIWPCLYFFFAVFTWLHCWSIWRQTVLHVRAQ